MQASKRNHIKWIWDLWKPHKGIIGILLFLTILSTASAVAYPYAFKKLLDSLNDILANPGEFASPMKEIYRIMLIILAIGISKLIASIYPGFRAMMNFTFEYALRNKYFSHILKKDYNFFNKYKTGDMVTRLTADLSDFPKIGWFLCSGIFRAFDSFSKIIFCVGMMFFINWKLTLLSMAPLPLMIVVFYITSERLYKSFKDNQEAISEINNQLEMSFSGARIIKAFACEKQYGRFFNKALDSRYKTELKLVKLNTILHLIYEYVDHFGQMGVILFGGYLTVTGEVTIGTFFAFYNYLSIMIFPLLDLPQLFVSGKQAFVNIDRLEDMKDFPIRHGISQGRQKIERIEKIEFRDVAFEYTGARSAALNDVSFSVEKGEKVLILGPVGAGKSTILGLLTGLFRPADGEIYVNDLALSEINLVHFRDKIGYVSQEPLLFSGTIMENVMFGVEQEDMALFENVVNAVQMRDEIAGFTDSHNSKVGQRGISLSGGQKQRLSIARALMKQPQVLVLDDITASLDADNEKLLLEELDRINRDVTCFIVSNRLTTLRYVDKVVFLHSGKMMAKGEHNCLMREHKIYRDFIEDHYITKD